MRKKTIPEEQEVNEEKKFKRGTTSGASYINIRKRPTYMAEPLATVPIGTPLIVIGDSEKSQFVEVEYKSQRGYIDRKYLKVWG